MKKIATTVSITLICLIGPAHAISLDTLKSTWSDENTFTTLLENVHTTGGASPAYGGFQSISPTATAFGFVNTTTPSGGTVDYNLGSTNLFSGTSLNLVFTDVSSAPSYVAYTGGDLTGYSYDAAAQTLSINASTVDPAGSASDADGSTLASAFGLVIETDPAHNFGGTVFQTDMYWGDLGNMVDYGGTSPAMGLNASGSNGQAVNFHAYASFATLASQGINEPADCGAYLEKSGIESSLPITRTIHTISGDDPGFAGGGYTNGETSIFDFDGDGNVDDYGKLSYTNSSWSDGNIGLVPVPEPAQTSLFIGWLVLFSQLLVTRRRLRENEKEGI